MWECSRRTNILELILLCNDLPRKSRALSIVARWDRSINGHNYAHVTHGKCSRKAFCTRVEISGASIINYKSTLVLHAIRTKHLSNNLDHVQSNTSRPIAENDTPFESRLKPSYLRKDYLGLLQMFHFVKSDSASNLQDKWKLVYVLVYFTENIAIDIIIS